MVPPVARLSGIAEWFFYFDNSYMPYNANTYEQEVLDFWKKDKTFEKSVHQRPENKPYVFYDGPPFATGLPHYGHILGSVVKDLIPRYKTMQGYRVRRRWGWDCHGLPIEQLIEKKLEISGKKQIEEDIGVEKFNNACHDAVLEYAGQWKTMVDRMGRWVEFDNAYKTMDSTYMESVWWSLKTIWDKGKIYEGWKVLQYCPRCETPISKAETAMDNSYKDVTEESVIIKFLSHAAAKKFALDGDVFLLAWTTTPWTLPGNLALAVGENIEYAVVAFDGAYYVVAKDLVASVFVDKNIDIVQNVFGKDLVGLSYEPFYDMPAMKETGKKAWYVAAADFVTTEDGTGIVHTAVMYGEDDYQLGKSLGLPEVPMLNDAGHFTDVFPPTQGQYFKKAEKTIKVDLEERGLLFARKQYTHSYPHCWRCGTALFYNAISAWFIDIQGEIKARMLELNERISWFPEHLKHGRFQHILETAPDWNISRNRYWATALPFWKCDSEDCCETVCVGSVAELKERAVNFSEVYDTDEVTKMDLHKNKMDLVKLHCSCGSEMTRIPEVIDCWVEAASMPFAEFHYPFENEEVFKKRFPGQFIAEYIAQTRAWFYYMHVMSTLLFDSNSFENVVTTGTIMNDKGEKLSKSKQNFTDPWIIIDQYGMDALRYYLMTSVVMQSENLNFVDREVRDVYNKVINLLWNVVTFYRMFQDQGTTKDTEQPPASPYVLDQWIVARLHALIREVTLHLDAYNTVKAGRPIKEFIDELSTWYVRRSRARFKGTDEQDKQAAIATLGYVLQELSKVMAPFTPFIAEKIWYAVTGKSTSVHLELWPTCEEPSSDEVQVLTDMPQVLKVVEMGLSLRKDTGVRVRQPLAEFSVFTTQFSNSQYADIIADELNVKYVLHTVVSGDGWHIKEDGDITVALNTTITDELKKEGFLREVVRAVNAMRKDQGLTREHRIVVGYHTDDALLKSVFVDFADELKAQVLADDIVVSSDGEVVDLEGIAVTLSVVKQ